MVWGPGTVAVRPESFRNYLEDVCFSLVKHGFRRFCFMNPHVGNVPLIAQTAAKLKMEHDVESCLFDWWRFIEPLCDREGILDNKGAMAHGHASEAGTSVLLYLRPDLVKMERAVRTEPKKVNPFPDIGVFWPIPSLTNTLMIGDATIDAQAAAAAGIGFVAYNRSREENWQSFGIRPLLQLRQWDEQACAAIRRLMQ